MIAVACVVKGCPWRGGDPYACPLHRAEEAWSQQGLLMNDVPSRRHHSRR